MRKGRLGQREDYAQREDYGKGKIKGQKED